MTPSTGEEDAPHPVLSLGLRQGVSAGHDILQLHRRSFARLNNLEITTFSTARAVVLSCPGLTADGALDVAAALGAGLLELVEEQQDTQAAVDFPRAPADAAPRDLTVPPRPSPTGYQKLASLELDSTAQVWKDALQAGKTYVLRFADDGRSQAWWCRYEDGDGEEKLPVALERASSVRFTVHADAAPPVFEAVFGVDPAGVAHRSGSPPFKFVVDLKSSAPSPVTVSTLRTPFGANLPFGGGGLNSVDDLVHCVDAETGEEPEWPAQFQCFDEDPWGAFPPDDHFVEVPPGGSWRFEYTLDRESNSTLGGLEALESGRRYRVELSSRAKAGFGDWMLGTKEELLHGTVEEKKKRWESGPRGRGSVRVEQANEAVPFDVVD